MIRKKKLSQAWSSSSMLSQTKGQAAMEFLMTYGWAILAAIIVVGVLWYIIGNPGNLAGEKFVLAPPLTAEAKQVIAGAVVNSIVLEIRNSVGETMNVRSASVIGCAVNDYSAAPIAVANGAVGTFTFDCTPDLITDDRFSGDIKITYRTGASALDQVSSGSISTRVP